MFKLFAPGRMPTHAEVAARQLADAQIELLEAQREQEAIEARVEALTRRVKRLKTYCVENPVLPVFRAPKKAQAQVWNFPAREEAAHG